MARILIADDSITTELMLSHILEEARHQVIAAGDGRHALAILQETPVDLLITDIDMPDLDGLALLRWLRMSAEFGQLPAIALTGLGQDSEQQAALAAGADTLLTKPTSSWELLETVDDLLESRHDR